MQSCLPRGTTWQGRIKTGSAPPGTSSARRVWARGPWRTWPGGGAGTAFHLGESADDP